MGPSEPNASEISLDSGVGGWTGTMRAGGTVSVWVASGGEKNTASWIFEIGLQQSSGKCVVKCNPGIISNVD